MTRKIKIGLAAAAGVAALTAGAAAVYAQPGELRGPMAMFDADSNGAVTLAEAQAGVARMIAAADADKDGRVTMDEMRAFHETMGERHRGGGHPGGHGGPGGPEGPREGRPGGPMHLDADGDGAVTQAEAEAGIQRHFAEIDSNRDGSVTAAELEAAHRAHHSGR